MWEIIRDPGLGIVWCWRMKLWFRAVPLNQQWNKYGNGNSMRMFPYVRCPWNNIYQSEDCRYHTRLPEHATLWNEFGRENI
jgi:hypothetical protein